MTYNGRVNGGWALGGEFQGQRRGMSQIRGEDFSHSIWEFECYTAIGHSLLLVKVGQVVFAFKVGQQPQN